ncbi:SGNH hydrolase [Dendrothele bispora CBS 962.96]|uniref:SGNH hydrolase n=1 Tax=Dendrothele bispora (strain CBS 962.96) TaxID=1314807 RepID=A0A4S8LYD1_DENBC|nr:SGNH hydrolase [Dendrothele bispora CBS 962.96]
MSSVPKIAASSDVKTKVIQNDDPLIYFHGRWDSTPGTWWAGSGLKLHVNNLKTLALNLGSHTTTPAAAIGVSLNYNEFITFNVSEGQNDIPLSQLGDLSFDSETSRPQTSVVRLNVEGWQNNRIDLRNITINSDANLLPYKPWRLAFQFIGDSLSAGQFLPKGVDQAWPFLVGEQFKAEHVIVAQPGATLTDIVSFGNEHGISFQFFRTEDTGYFYTTDHNFTTPWNFARDVPAATHVVIHIGANDASQGVSDNEFVQVYTTFLQRLRSIYHHQPIFVFTPWGWPNADGSISQYYPGLHQQIVQMRHDIGDEQVFLVNTTGWVTWDDVFPDNVHPNVPGHQKIANLFGQWLEQWGLEPEQKWATAV